MFQTPPESLAIFNALESSYRLSKRRINPGTAFEKRALPKGQPIPYTEETVCEVVDLRTKRVYAEATGSTELEAVVNAARKAQTVAAAGGRPLTASDQAERLLLEKDEEIRRLKAMLAGGGESSPDDAPTSAATEGSGEISKHELAMALRGRGVAFDTGASREALLELARNNGLVTESAAAA